SGNSGTNEMHYPSGFAETISVAATDSLDNIAGFSTWGQTIDLSAPGENIYSCKIGGGYNYSNGTSFSAPMVSAAAGLILTNHPGFNNEQVRNILKSSADDHGSIGWDPYYGSGRLNLLTTSQINEKSALFIESPISGSYTFSDSIPIIVTLQDVDLQQASLWLREGNNSQNWQEIVSEINHQIISDTIAVLDLANYSDTLLVFKLEIQTWQGEIKEYRSLLFVDKTAPVISTPDKMTMLDENRFAILIGFETDDITTGEIYFRPKSSTVPFTAKNLQYETRQHRVKIRSDEISGDVEFYIRVENLAGLPSQGSGGKDYTFDLSSEIIPPIPFPQLNWTFQKGYVLSRVADFDNDGNSEVILSLYDENNSFGKVAIFEFEINQFVKKYETSFRAIPRDFGDADGDGKLELLVGFGKNSFLVEANVINGFPQQIVWQDTADFWASRITDLDGDGLKEILGRSGAEYKLLETSGDNFFTEKYSFANISGGNNAFGPPTTVVADFDGDSFSDLVFGDYDGDILIYENTGDDTFVNRFLTQLPLPDATDYLASGKFIDSTRASLIAGTHTDYAINYEHEFDSRYWSFFHILAENDNSYVIKQRINIFGYSDIRDFDSGVSSGTDPMAANDYLFISVYPDLYIFQANGDSLVPIWYVNGVQSNKVIMHDFNKNGVPEIYFNNGQSFIGYELGESNQPPPPADFSAIPLDTTKIILEWQLVTGAQKYIIYRGLEGQG
ncbi:MAG: S8 family serine peptidase, partial [Calditrichia bacterium]